MEAKKKGYGMGFWTVACTEIFERLAFYLGRSIILIFVTATVATGGLGLSESTGANIQANLTAFTYLGALLGGIVVDRFIGARYAAVIGALIAGVGYFFGSIATNAGMIYLMIFTVSVGLGLLRTTTIIGRVVENKKEMDSAFAIKYTFTNVGAFFGSFLVGILYKDVFAQNGVLGFVPCFRLAALSMVGAALWLGLVCTRYIGDVGKRPFKEEKTEKELEEEAKQKELNKELRKAKMTTMEKKRIGAIFLVSAFSIIFWIFWYLGYVPVYYHWAENMNWVILGYEVPVTWFDATNALLCIILGPVSAKFWRYLASRPQGDMSLYRKIGIGIGILGVGYIIQAGFEIMRGDGKISALWLIIFVCMLSLGEMFFSPLGHSFIAKYAPSRYLGVLMSVWGIAIFFAAKSYGYVYSFVFEGHFTFTTGCFGIAAVAILSAIALFILDKPLTSLVEKEEDE